MLIVNYSRLFVDEALKDTTHPMHAYAKEYSQGLAELQKKYPEGTITFKDAAEPPTVDKFDSKNHEYRDVPEDPKPIAIPLAANVSHPKRGKEYWGVCTGTPYHVREGVWDIADNKGTRSKKVTGSFIVNLKTDPDLAFFFAFKSPLITGGHWKIDDPKADIKAQGDAERDSLAIKTAIWQNLNDETQLRTIAASYGISGVKDKEPDALRFELENVLKENNKKKQVDPSYRGTEEFMEDLKINDYVRLSAFIRHFLDEAKIVYRKDGRFKIGDKAIAQVPADHVNNRFAWLCNYFNAPNNVDRLRELMTDLVNKDYLDSLAVDSKDFRWLAKVMDITGYFNKTAEEVREMVYELFVI
jgi:hypothetical protein